MLESVAGKNRVVLLDVDLDLLLEAVRLEEAVDGRHVVIILMLGRLLRLRLDEYRALEADLVLVVDDQIEEAAGLPELAFEIGVEQCLVAFAAAPHHIILAAQILGHIEAVLHLRGAIGKDIGIGIGRRAGHEPPVREHVGSPPQEPDAGLGHLVRKIGGDRADILVELLQAPAFGREIEIMEGEVIDAEQPQGLEHHVSLGAGMIHCIARPMPGPEECLTAEGVEARPDERVPIAHRKTQMLRHGLAEHLLLGVVPAKGERIAAIGPFVPDGIGD